MLVSDKPINICERQLSLIKMIQKFANPIVNLYFYILTQLDDCLLAAVSFVSKYKLCWAYFLVLHKNVFLLLNISDK